MFPFPNMQCSVLGGAFDYLVAAAGGSGGDASAVQPNGGGGGAGGLIQGSSYLAVGASLAVTVGQPVANQNGQDSSLGAVAVAIGGGKGGSVNNQAGSNGGSGGGAWGNVAAAGSGTPGQGNDGGSIDTNVQASGGGGGAGGTGTMSVFNVGAGPGLASSISGVSVTYCKGGNAGGSQPGINPGDGSDGRGASGPSVKLASPGIIICRYRTGAMIATGGTITTVGDFTIHTFTANGTFQRTA